LTDIVPIRHSRVASIINAVFHPAVICIPTLLIILSGEDPQRIAIWSAVSLVVLLVPALIVIWLLQRQGRLTYQRETRLPIYVTGISAVVVNLLIMIVWDAPQILIACFATLLIWLPVQVIVNQWITKLSAHTAVVAGCLTGLLVAGKIAPVPGIVIVVICVLLVGYARIVTRNHTLQQVILGAIIGTLPVLVVFPLVMQAS
jgi:membrane-associated phospholipid phosphatase